MNEKILSVLRFACLGYLAFFVPKCISWYSAFNWHSKVSVYNGIDVLISSPKKYKFLKRVRLAFIGNDPSKLQENGFDIKQTFLLQNSNRVDLFLYKKCRNVDVVLVDLIPDGFCSSYIHTFLKTVLKFCARYKKGLVVLDRPNPLGAVIEGPGDVPWRYGVTIGELARYYNKYVVKKSARITSMRVIPMKKWRRSQGLQQTVNFLSPIDAITPLSVLSSDNGNFCKLSSLSKWEVRHLKRLCWKLGLHCFEHTIDGSYGLHFSLKSDVTKFSAFNSFLTIIRFLNNRKTITLSFKKKLDKIFKNSDVRGFFQNRLSFNQLRNKTEKSLNAFYDKVKHCCLYKPIPVVVTPAIG
jgi:hypothetical protein